MYAQSYVGEAQTDFYYLKPVGFFKQHLFFRCDIFDLVMFLTGLSGYENGGRAVVKWVYFYCTDNSFNSFQVGEMLFFRQVEQILESCILLGF